LSLSDNQIGKEGAIAIAIVLKVNNTLKKLELDNNKLGDVEHLAGFEFNVRTRYERTATRLNIQIPFTDMTVQISHLSYPYFN
jgi:hypothetical protein